MVPDLAIEIMSPTNLHGEIEEKIDEYFRVGVSRVRVVHPNIGKIYVYDAPESVRAVVRGQSLTDEALLPGFQLDLNQFFGPPDPRPPAA